jgi:hypothetical protein
MIPNGSYQINLRNLITIEYLQSVGIDKIEEHNIAERTGLINSCRAYILHCDFIGVFYLQYMRDILLLFLCLSLQPSPNADLIRYKLIQQSGHTYGYDIISGGHILIHQVTIPGRPGNNGFLRKSDARKVAEFVVGKIRKGVLPPTVTRHEMDSLKVNY